MKSFGDSCPNVVVTNRREAATFTVFLERESGKWLRRDNKMVVFDQAGDMVFGASDRELGSAVRGFCTSVLNATRFGAPGSLPNTLPGAR
jgi:hypothetical protein